MVSGITSNNLPPAIQRQVQNAVQNGGTIDIGKLLVLQGVSIANNTANNTTNNNSSPWLDLLTQLPQIMFAAIFGTNNTSTTNNVASTESTTQTNTKDIQSVKQGLNNDLNELKALGVKVSDWDNNNSCTLSYQGKTGTVTITDSGQVSFGGDIDGIMELLKQDPQEKESVDNQNKFLAKMENSGDPIIGNVKTTKIKVKGKEISVNEYTSQSGKKYYLDSSGKEITPEITT
mgnify:CR=1 FL=1